MIDTVGTQKATITALASSNCPLFIPSLKWTDQITAVRPSALFHQCIIYDSDEPTARLIGIEYIVSEEVSSYLAALTGGYVRHVLLPQTFKALPTEEKRYWHSHKYEV